MEKIYYSPKGFWRGQTAIKRLAKEAKVSEKQARILEKASNLADIFTRT